MILTILILKQKWINNKDFLFSKTLGIDKAKNNISFLIVKLVVFYREPSPSPSFKSFVRCSF